MTAHANDERALVLSFIRREAERARSVASEYRIKHVNEEARVWRKIDETLGNIANRIEREEHLAEKVTP